MKILREGKLKGDKSYRHTCRECNCFFEFKEKEAEFESSPKNESYWKVACPYCKTLLYVDEVNLISTEPSTGSYRVTLFGNTEWGVK